MDMAEEFLREIDAGGWKGKSIRGLVDFEVLRKDGEIYIETQPENESHLSSFLPEHVLDRILYPGKVPCQQVYSPREDNW